MSLPTPPVQTWNPHPSTPTMQLPAGSCDAHVHVFGPAARFAYVPTRNPTPADAPKESLFALHRHLGIERCVIVQASVHGMDNSVVADAIRAGAGRYLGIALVPVDVTDAHLVSLAQSGFRGVRFNFMKHLGPGADIEDVIGLSHRLAPLGMHLQVHFESSLVHGLRPALKRSAVPVVIDHMGRVDARLGAEHADFVALKALMADRRMQVKVSGIDRIDAQPPYEQGVSLARELVERFPAQCLWGTDWPHPNLKNHMPDDGLLVDFIPHIAPTEELQRKLLVDNPMRLYWKD